MEEYEIGYRPTTRVGKYLWDIDIESMGIDELDALLMIVSDMKNKREKEQKLLNMFKRTLEKAEEAGYHFCYETPSMYVDLNYGFSSGNVKLEEKD